MHERDIDLYLKAKAQLKMKRRIFILCAAIFIVWIVLKLFGVNDTTYDAIAVGLMLASLVNVNGTSFGTNVSESALLGIIARQINANPEAVAIMRRKKSDR